MSCRDRRVGVVCRVAIAGWASYVVSRSPGGRRTPCPDRQVDELHWSGPLVNSRGRFLWRSRTGLWTRTGRTVDDLEELGVRRSSGREPLVAGRSGAVELLSRNPSGESGIGRRRRSVPPPPACRRGWRWPGDEAAGIGVADWIDRERHQYRSSGEPPDPGLVPRPSGSPHQKGPCSSYLRGPFYYFRAISDASEDPPS